MNDPDMQSDCLSCAIVSGRKESLGGTIAETSLFHAHQDYAWPIPGFVIVASKRHFRCLDEMTEAEGTDFILFSMRIRAAQRAVLGIAHVYYFYNEDTKHHFHLWMAPRYDWMSQFGKSVEAIRPAMRHARDTMASPDELEAVAEAASKLRSFLN